MTSQSWTCPFCNLSQLITDNAISTGQIVFDTHSSKHGYSRLHAQAVTCANPACQEITLNAQLNEIRNPYNQAKRSLGKRIDAWALRPKSAGKPQPDYIPAVIISDYMEACAIRDLSPKASATLARRCLQGMIRDFCGISEKRLVDEIKILSELVASGKGPSGVHEDVLKAIDGVRQVGNIGAHMEADINVIIDVDPNEAQILIELLELLFEEWYIARNTRNERLSKMQKIAEAKAVLKSSNTEKKSETA